MPNLAMEADAILSKISLSPWADVRTPRISAFIHPQHDSCLYGIYSPGIDRFLAVDRLDPWTVLHAAKILSSKISLVVYALPKDAPPITNANCLKWSITNKSVQLSLVQTPILDVLSSKDDVIEEGLPLDFSDNLESLVRDQEFALFILRASCALRLTDAMLNTSDHAFYAKLFPKLESEVDFSIAIDESRWPGGFVQAMEQILYKANSIEDALRMITIFLPFGLTSMRIISAFYAKTFFDFLDWKPS